MTFDCVKVSFDGEYYTYSLNFEWSRSEGDSISIAVKYYHTQATLFRRSSSTVIGTDDGFFYALLWETAVPYFKYEIVYTTNITRSDTIVIDEHPNHRIDSYMKNNRPPIHNQFAYYANSKYYYSVESCVANALCAGMDCCYRTLYGQTAPLRPSVGYFYGAVHKDKDEAFGMLFETALNYLKVNGVPNASILDGEADHSRTERTYPNNYTKLNKLITEKDGVTTRVVSGAVNMHNKNSVRPVVIESEKHAMISSWKALNTVTDIYETMNDVMNNNKFVTLSYGLSSEVYEASENRTGVCGRLMANTEYSGGHASFIIGWKKIGDEYYWIVQNSWGEYKGDNGLLYIPVSWYWFNNGNGQCGLWWSYSCTYLNNGTSLLPAISPPVLDTLKGKDGRGDRGILYLTSNKIDSTTNENASYTVKFVDSKGIESERSFYPPSSSIITGKYGETLKIAIKYTMSMGGSSAYSAYNIATTLPKEPTISKKESTTNMISINVGVSEGNYTDVAIHLYVNDVYNKTVIVPKGQGFGVFSGLLPNTTYKFIAETRYVINGVTLKSFKTSATLSVTTGVNVLPFYWSSKVVQNGEILNNEGSDNKWYAYPITSTEWNSYIDTLKKVRAIKKVTTSRQLDDVGRGNPITTYVNQAINALNDMLTTKLSNITSTSTLTAQVFLDLQNKLNDIIKTL